MEAHNFNILELKIKQAIDEISNLKKENAELLTRINESSTNTVSSDSSIGDDKKTELLNKVDEMLEVLDRL